MKVIITQESRKAGLLGGKTEWQTSMRIMASEEEKAILASGNVGDFPVASFPTIFGGSEVEYTAEQLLSQEIDIYRPNKWAANEIAKDMKSAAGRLKQLMEDTMADESGEFEL